MSSRKSSISNLQSSMLSALLAAGMMLAGTAQAQVLATGGDVVTYTENGTNFTAHIFKKTDSNATLTTNITFYGDAPVEYLIVAGGGGGGRSHGGGGGAGGFLTGSTDISAGTIGIIVGQGGAGGSDGSEHGKPGTGSSFGAITATGGGGGKSQSDAWNVIANGGSGGGGAGAGGGGPSTGGTGISGQGYAGGAGLWTAQENGGGGGGAGSVGTNATSSGLGHGGIGKESTFASGVGGTYYAGGGGGGGTDGDIGGTGGQGGGGHGGDNGGATSLTAGTLATGGGGGGNRGGSGAAGGSGIVIVRYSQPAADAPAIYNRAITGVTATPTATFNGLLVSTGSSACAVCVLWGENDGGETWNWAKTNWFNNGNPDPNFTNNTPFSIDITAADGLEANKGYYYRFAATNASTNAVAPTVKPFITGEVTVEATDPTASMSPYNTGAFTIRRPETCTNAPVTVDFTMGGTGVQNTDYTLSISGSATLNVGESNKVITLTPISLVEKTAELRLTLASDNEYPVGTASNATVTIKEALGKGGSIVGYQEGGTNFTAHIFKNTVNATLNTNITFNFVGPVEYLVVAGGGQGGYSHGGGGGAGGFLTGSTDISAGTLGIIVGKGGTGSANAGAKGTDSSFGALTATGGGGGRSQADAWNPSANGGSGGGGAGKDGGGPSTGGTGVSGQGRDGGDGNWTTGPDGGGGGGANEEGYNGSNGTPGGGNGGAGKESTFASGAGGTYYAGGGGGGGEGGRLGGAGGLGGGGHGGDNGGTGNMTAGALGTGGGGGGTRGGAQNNPGAAGGSGIVIVRYAPPAPTVIVTAPTNTQTFYSDSAITATAGVWAASETCTVRFYTNSTPGGDFGLAGEDSGAPYTAVLGMLANGNYSIYATASNATDGVLTSTTNAFSVVPKPPLVTSVTSTKADGAYKAGETIDVTVTFDVIVTVVGGPPLLKLETGATDRYATNTSGSGSTTLTFQYTVQAGDTSSDLDYWSTGALELNGATIKDALNYDAVLTLPAPGAANSLGANKALVIDTTPQTVTGVTSGKANGSYKAGEQIDITVTFNGTVYVTGTPQLELETGATDRQVDYLSGSPGTTLTFRYTVQAGDTSGDLDYTGTGALTLNSGTIKDAAGNDATLTLAAPGAATSLGANKALVIDTTAETLSSIADNDSDNVMYATKTVTYTLTFSDDILHTTVNAGDFDNAAASPSAITVGTITETSPGVFTVAVTPTSAGNLQLRVKADAGITDPAGNAVSNLPQTGGDTIAVSMMPPPMASGGAWDYYEEGGTFYWSHTFANSVNATLTTNITFDFDGAVYYLVVAGGGSGGAQHGGGGGAGGMVTGSLEVVKGSTLDITVGRGGPAVAGEGAGVNGDDSVFATTIRAFGGGGGRFLNGFNPCVSGDGGSGGGGAGMYNTAGGARTNDQGNVGGNGSNTSAGAGGGGAGEKGDDIPTGVWTPGGDGGDGLPCTFASGVATYYAGGGGGGGGNEGSGLGGAGGQGGGGHGGDGGPANMTAGTLGTGGGGGGNRHNNGSARGGSGIVIIRYSKPPTKGTVILLR